jgi:MscS family membrane protein
MTILDPMSETLSRWLQSLRDFWSIVVDVWQQGVFGLDLGSILTALLVFVLFWSLRRVLARFVLRRLHAWSQRTNWRFDDHIVKALDAPMRFVPVVLGTFFAFQILDLSGDVADVGYRVIRSLVVVVMFWGLRNLVDPLSAMLAKLEGVFTSVMIEWLIKAVSAGVLLVGAATVLQIWGIQIGPVLAGLGLLGVAVALGAQDLFKNLIAGLLIIIEKRFSHGDWILVDGVVEGTVESFGFRSTVVRRFDKAPVHVPNSRLSDNAVTNFSAMTYRRIYWRIGVVYGTTIEQLRQIRDEIERYVLESDEFVSPEEAPTFVRVDSFGDSSIDIMLYCFTRTTNWGEWLAAKERLAYEVKQIVEGAGSSFAFPSRSLYIETPAGERAEVFVPPTETPEPRPSRGVG